MGRRGSKILSIKVGLIVYVCVWGGGGGLYSLHEERANSSKFTLEREQTAGENLFSCIFQDTDQEPSTIFFVQLPSDRLGAVHLLNCW